MAEDNWLNNSRSPTRQIGFNDMNLKRLFLQFITSWYERFTFHRTDMWMQPRLYILSIISRINYQSNNLFDIQKGLWDINGKLWHRRRGPFFSCNLIWRLLTVVLVTVLSRWSDGNQMVIHCAWFTRVINMSIPSHYQFHLIT